MEININLPKITAPTPTEQVRQMYSYLYQVVEQLNWAFSNIDTANNSNNTSSSAAESPQNEVLTPQEAENTFNSIKALIIKSADIVKAYEETIKEDFSGEYIAISDFGTYTEKTDAQIEENSKGLTAVYTNVQTIGDDIRTTNAYIKRGLIGYDDSGKAIYGVEVGETNDKGVFLKYARFKSDRLSFYDANGSEVAYIGAGCLYILGVSRFIGDVYFGGYRADTSDGLAFAWIE
jgi:hypothetical protein